MAAHKTRMSDSTLYDEVCVDCGITDADGPITGDCPVTTQDIEDALLHSEAESEGTCNCCHGAECPTHDRLPVTIEQVGPAFKIEALILKSEKMQTELIAEVGRPSSHIHSRIKALKDALEIVTGKPVARSPFENG